MQERRGLTLYNPAVLGKEDLIAQFTLRADLLETFRTDLRHADGNTSPQHHLITGPRGMGKTTLLLRLRYLIEDDESLCERVFPLTFPEEQYDVRDLASLWRNALDALADALDLRGRKQEAAEVDRRAREAERLEPTRRTDALLGLLLEWAERNNVIFTLLLDNLDQVLGRLREKDQWALRKTLADCPRLLVFGASTVPPSETYDYSKAFYDFFRHHTLDAVSIEDASRYLCHMAALRRAPQVAEAVTKHPERLRAIHVLTGGSPRALATLFLVLSEADDLSAASALESVLDVVTPYYKHIVESLPERQQIVVDALAKHWDPAPARVIATITGLPVTEVNSNLKRLENAGMLTKITLPGGGRFVYYLSERLLNIWYLMRASRRVRDQLLWLVKFLEVLYTPDEIGERAQKWLRPEGADSGGAVAALTLAYSTLLRASDPTLSQALEMAAADALANSQVAGRIGEHGATWQGDAALEPLVERKRTIEQVRAAIDEIATRYGYSDAEKRSVAFNTVLVVSSLGLPLVPKELAGTSREHADGLFEDAEQGSALLLHDLSEDERDSIRSAVLCGDVYLNAPPSVINAAARRWHAPNLGLWTAQIELASLETGLGFRLRPASELLRLAQTGTNASLIPYFIHALLSALDDEAIDSALGETMSPMFLGVHPWTANVAVLCGGRRLPKVLARIIRGIALDPRIADREAGSEILPSLMTATIQYAVLVGLDATRALLHECELTRGLRPLDEFLRLAPSGDRATLQSLAPELRQATASLWDLWDEMRSAPASADSTDSA